MIADSIEANVENAAVSVEQGTEQLRQARQHQVTNTNKAILTVTAACDVQLVSDIVWTVSVLTVYFLLLVMNNFYHTSFRLFQWGGIMCSPSCM